MIKIRISAKDDSPMETVVYMATNSVNGKRYIGLTCQYLSQRKSKHFWCAEKENSPTYFHRAIRKYGRPAFSFEVIETCSSFKEANERERFLIEQMRPEYNVTKGGEGYLGYVPTEEVRKQHSERMKLRPPFWKGKELPKTFRSGGDMWRASEQGKKSWNEHRQKGPKAIAKKLVCLDDGMIFESASSAARHYGINKSSISAVCNRSAKRRVAGGLVFRYFGDHKGGKAEADEMRRLADKSGRRLAKPHYQKRVRCLDDGREFDSAKAASVFYGIHYGTVTAVCAKRPYCHTAGGKVFEYIGTP